MKIIAYKIIAADPSKIDDLCKPCIEQGWQPFGPPDCHTHDGHPTVMHQTLVKYESDPLDKLVPTLDQWMAQVTGILTGLNAVPQVQRANLQNTYNEWNDLIT